MPNFVMRDYNKLFCFIGCMVENCDTQNYL